jgi:hypothetical protein
MKQYFRLDSIPSQINKYLIYLNHENWPEMRTEGSYALMASRMCGLSFGDYLRYCRDVLGAEISGQNCYYPLVVFSGDSIENGRKFVDELNKRAAQIVG